MQPPDDETRSQLLSRLNTANHNLAMIQQARQRSNSFGLGQGLSLASLQSLPSFSGGIHSAATMRNSMVGSIGTQNHTTFSNPHYPSPRLAASFLNNVNTGTATTQSPMGAKSIASGVAPGLMNYPATTTTLKRRSIDYLGSSPNSYPKKPKLSGGESHSIKGDAPIFMERLSSMSGFRMPKSWGLNGAGGLATGAEEGSSSKKKTPDKTALRLLPKHGIFPMPALHEAKKCTRFSLDKFNKLWDETDADIRAEVFARRLERTNMSLPPSNYWSSPTSGSGSRRHPHF